MRLQYFTVYSEDFIFPFFYTEIFLLLLNVFVYACSIYVVFHTRFHFNLRFIIIYILGQYYTAIVSRSVIILYQLRVFTFKGSPDDCPIIVWSSFFRMFFFGLCFVGITGLFWERWLATHFLSDYERRRRPSIAVGIISTMTAFSLAGAYIFTFDLIPWYISVSVGGSATIPSFMAFFRLYRSNKRRWRLATSRSLFERNGVLEYSLSLRFQLEENVKSMKLMHNGFVLLGLINIWASAFYVFANLSVVRELGPNIWQALDCSFNLLITLNGLLVPIGVLFTQDEYMAKVKDMRVLGWAFRWYILPEIEGGTTDETAVYFSTLKSQWDEPLDLPPIRRHFKRSKSFPQPIWRKTTIHAGPRVVSAEL